MKLSQKFTLKYINAIFKPVSKSLIRTFFRYMIDSKYRTSKRIDKYLKDQLDNPSPNVLKLAKTFKRGNHNQRIVWILQWVHKNIKYQSDLENYDKVEYWSSAEETLKNKRGDCDNLNSLIYVLAVLSGIPSYLLWNMIGETNIGGHYWLTFYSARHEQLFIIDATFYPDMDHIPNRCVFDYFSYKKVWYIFNEDNIFR